MPEDLISYYAQPAVWGTVWDFGGARFLRMKACLLEVTHRDHLQAMFINPLQGLTDLTMGPCNVNISLFYKGICTMTPKVL